MTMQHIRDFYGLKIKRGQRVRVKAWDGWTDGRITSATHHVIIAPDKWPLARFRCHPTDRETWCPADDSNNMSSNA